VGLGAVVADMSDEYSVSVSMLDDVILKDLSKGGVGVGGLCLPRCANRWNSPGLGVMRRAALDVRASGSAAAATG
jgi:hypothetical protein